MALAASTWTPDDTAAWRHELAQQCATFWALALGRYFEDARLAAQGKPPDNFEALEDLTGSRELLANLCRPFDGDAQALGHVTQGLAF